MISLGFINGESEALLATDEYVEFENTLEKIEDSLQAAYDEYSVYEKAYEAELFVMEEVSKETSDKKEEKQLNVVEKIGKAITEIVKAFIRFVQRIGERIQNFGFENKSEFEKIQKLANSKTEYKSQIIDAIKAGDLDISSAKNLKEIESLYYEFLADARSKNPKEAKEKFLYKLKNIDKSTGVKVVAAATGAVSLGVAIMKLPQLYNQLKNTGKNAQASSTDILNKTLDLQKKMIDQRQHMPSKEYNEWMSDINDALRVCMSEHTKAYKKDVDKLNKVSNAVKTKVFSLANVGDAIKNAAAKVAPKKPAANTP